MIFTAEVRSPDGSWFAAFRDADAGLVRKFADAHSHRLAYEGTDTDIRVIDDAGNVYWWWLWADFRKIGTVDNYVSCQDYYSNQEPTPGDHTGEVSGVSVNLRFIDLS